MKFKNKTILKLFGQLQADHLGEMIIHLQDDFIKKIQGGIVYSNTGCWNESCADSNNGCTNWTCSGKNNNCSNH